MAGGVIVPIVDQEPVRFIAVEPAGFDEGGQQLLGVARPVGEDGNFLVCVSTDITSWTLRRGRHPETLQEPDSLMLRESQVALKAAELQ